MPMLDWPRTNGILLQWCCELGIIDRTAFSELTGCK